MTETDDLAVALDAATRRWPGLSRSRLLVRLALEGDHAARATLASFDDRLTQTAEDRNVPVLRR